MRKLLKFLVAVFLVLCLPLQGLAGVTMPACAGHAPVAVQMADDHDAMESHCQHMKMAAEKKAHDHKISHDKCAACYISVSQAIVPQVTVAVPLLGTTAYSHLALVEYQTQLSTPYHPPRSTAAQG
ncbi:benzoate transporter [Novimethylophilus kurashikiensis]|uniref:Benzoate transporter n=1 Tax=Novimethylophilus kurashikiensis TaxID=1825523 RepID=A0A2R5F9N9_9PROT|nr:hypothetical protein [Novimethylophilus kurashikiensis]GBG13354.1 benzoate transporter [Novimethylophilus kurashikiensis]